MQTHNLPFSLTFLDGTELCTHTHLVQLEDGPSLLTVWRPHDFIFGAVRGGPHYVSARLNGLFVLAWLWSSSAWGSGGRETGGRREVVEIWERHGNWEKTWEDEG